MHSFSTCAPVHSGGWWPPKRHWTQKVKQCTTNLNTAVICNMLKLSLITFSKTLNLSSYTLSDEVSNGNIGQFLNVFNFSERTEDN
jgi:hypothetical protein